MSVSVSGQLDSILPAHVLQFELVSDVIPLLHAGDMALEINGAFVGSVAVRRCGRGWILKILLQA